MQPLFIYDDHTAAALRESVSTERLQRYEILAAGNSALALRLYMWNTALSESLYGPIQGFEITLRNKMHARFAAQFGQHWYDEPGMGLLYHQQDQVMRAKQSLRKQGKALDPQDWLLN